MLPLFRCLLPRLLRPLTLRPAAATGRNVRAFASGGMFESLTSSMGATFKKLLGRKTVTREEVDVALASVHDALVDAAGSEIGTLRTEGLWLDDADTDVVCCGPGWLDDVATLHVPFYSLTVDPLAATATTQATSLKARSASRW